MTDKQKDALAVGMVGAGTAVPAGVVGHRLGKRRVAELVAKRMKTPSSAQSIWARARWRNQQTKYINEVLNPAKGTGKTIPSFEEWRPVHSARAFFRAKLPTRAPLKRIPTRAAAAAAIIAGALGAAGTYGIIHRRHKKR